MASLKQLDLDSSPIECLRGKLRFRGSIPSSCFTNRLDSVGNLKWSANTLVESSAWYAKAWVRGFILSHLFDRMANLRYVTRMAQSAKHLYSQKRSRIRSKPQSKEKRKMPKPFPMQKKAVLDMDLILSEIIAIPFYIKTRSEEKSERKTMCIQPMWCHFVYLCMTKFFVQLNTFSFFCFLSYDIEKSFFLEVKLLSPFWVNILY